MSRADRIAKRLGLFLATIVSIGMVVALADEGLRFYRGSMNLAGQAVPGYGLYEKAYSSTLLDEELRKIGSLLPSNVPSKKGWQLVDFSQWKVFCRFQQQIKQSAWLDERERLLKIRGGFSMVFPQDEPSEIWSSTAPELSSDDPVREVLYLKNVEKRFGSLPEGPLLYKDADLPVERYLCQPTKMFYQSGQGWGLF